MKSYQTNYIQKVRFQIANQQKHCSNGNISTYICSNKNCTLNAFVCEHKQCECRLTHPMCIPMETFTIVNALLSKSISLEPLIIKIEELFQKGIDQLSEMRSKIIHQFQQRYQLQGLQQRQIDLIKSLQSSDQDKKISCNSMWKLMVNIHNTKKNLKKIQFLQKDIDELYNNFQQSLNKFGVSCESFLQKINLPFRSFQQSKVILNKQDDQQLINYFKKPIQNVSLLFRASEHRFYVKKFHQLCGNESDTLTICSTQNGKIIGGYTPVKWHQQTHGNYMSDPKKQSFLFSLTQNQKIPLSKNIDKAIYNNNKYGPVFGCGHDLAIFDQAHRVKLSTNIGYSYNNGKYQQGQTFCGNNFYAKEWEVWKVQFSVN